jgi:hypothetical protein
LKFPVISGFGPHSTPWSIWQPTFNWPLRHPLVQVYPHNLSSLLALTAPQPPAGYTIQVLMTATPTPPPSACWWPEPPPSSSWTSLPFCSPSGLRAKKTRWRTASLRTTTLLTTCYFPSSVPPSPHRFQRASRSVHFRASSTRKS